MSSRANHLSISEYYQMHTGYARGAHCDSLGDMKELGKLIKSARERRGYITQQQAADAIGINLSKYNRLENGTTKELPVPDDLRRISEAMGLSVESLLTAAGYLDPPSEDEPSDVVTVRRDDPRADLLAMLEGETDEGVRRAADLINAIRMYSGSTNKSGGVPSSGRNDDKPDSPNHRTA